MTARFAGSRHLDQRRRRRIAQETAPSPVQRRAPSVQASFADQEGAVAEVESSGPNFDESLIPRSAWKIAALCLGGLAFWGTMLWIGTDPSWNGSALEEVVGLRSGRIAKFFSTVALLGASQLSTLILWYRSKSRKDFAGRYRIWVWASMYWSVLCLGAATGFHKPLAAMLYDYWRLECWRPQIVYWLGPTAAGFVALYTLLGRELRQSPVSRCLWNLCALCGIAVSLLALGLDVSLPENIRLAADVGTVTLWHYLAASTFLVHARFVVHINNEAAPKLKPMPNRVVAWYLQLIRRLLSLRLLRVRIPKLSLRLPRFSRPKLPQGDVAAKPRRNTPDVVAETAASREDSRQTGPASTSSTTAAALKGASQPVSSNRPNRKLRVDPPQTAAAAPKAQPSPAPPARPSRPENAGESRWDDELDLHDDFDGIDFSKLSRKERRKLRKLRKSEGR